jgi:uncharacterized membrane protein
MADKQQFIKQTSPAGNAYASTHNLLQLINVNVTSTTLDEMLRTHHAFPAITAVSDTLEDLGMDTMVVKLDTTQLHEAGFPCIAHLKKNNGHFVVLKAIDEKNIHIIDPIDGETTLSLAEFSNEWSGAVVLVNKNDHAGERGYHNKKREEQISRSRLPLALSIIAVLSVASSIVSTAGSFANVWSLLIVTKAAGLILSILLLLHYFSSASEIVQRLCPTGKKLNCQGVLHTPAAKIFGIPMADIGALYFTGGLLSLLFMSFTQTGDHVIWMLAMINLLTLPYTVFSIVYQAFVAKQWCWMCVAIQGLLWIEFAILAGSGYLDVHSIEVSSILVCSWSFLLPAAAWLLVRPLIQQSVKVAPLTEQILRLRRNPYLFGTLLNAQRKISRGAQLPVEIEQGDPSAAILITMVSQPHCPTCAVTHQYIDELLEQFPGLIRVVTRFYCAAGTQGREIAEGVIGIALTGERERAWEAMSKGYKVRGEAALNKWKNEFAVPDADKTLINSLLDYHLQWCNSLNIKATPTFFVDDRPLPEDFSIYDLKPLLRLKCKEMEALAEKPTA